MRAAIVLVAVLVLVGCASVTGPAAGPVTTVDTTTPSGYRISTEARGNQINQAVEALHAACSRGAIADCSAALPGFEATIATIGEQLRTTAVPQGCGGLYGGFLGLTLQAQGYGETLRQALLGGNPATVGAADTAGYAGWQHGWTNNTEAIRADPCKQ